MISGRLRLLTCVLWVLIAYPLALGAEWLVAFGSFIGLPKLSILVLFLGTMATAVVFAWLIRWTASFTRLRQLHFLLCSKASDLDACYRIFLLSQVFDLHAQRDITDHQLLKLLAAVEDADLIQEIVTTVSERPRIRRELYDAAFSAESLRRKSNHSVSRKDRGKIGRQSKRFYLEHFTQREMPCLM